MSNRNWKKHNYSPKFGKKAPSLFYEIWNCFKQLSKSLWCPFSKCINKQVSISFDTLAQIQQLWLHPVGGEKIPQSDRRYNKMLLLILDYLIWLMAAASFIFWERVMTFMAGRRPSKGLRAWQTHRDGDFKWGQDNAGAHWVWDLWELVKPCGASGGLGFSPDTFTNATLPFTQMCNQPEVTVLGSLLYLHRNKKQTHHETDLFISYALWAYMQTQAFALAEAHFNMCKI